MHSNQQAGGSEGTDCIQWDIFLALSECHQRSYPQLYTVYTYVMSASQKQKKTSTKKTTKQAIRTSHNHSLMITAQKYVSKPAALSSLQSHGAPLKHCPYEERPLVRSYTEAAWCRQTGRLSVSGGIKALVGWA